MAPIPEELQAMLRAEPFQPLRIRLSDGSSYVITHPNLTLVTRLRLAIGRCATARDVAERDVTISLLHVVRREPLGPVP